MELIMLGTGNAVVTDIISDNKDYTSEIAAIAESGSIHPLAKAVTQYAKTHGITINKQPENLQNKAGKGIECVISGEEVLIGRLSFAEEKA